MSRYSRHIVLSDVGQIGQDKLSNAKVLVVGAGGLGCPVLQYLTAAGIGTLGVIDFDIVQESNLQRQILFGTSSIGKLKAIEAKKRLEDLNPTITIHAYTDKLTYSNSRNLFNLYDIIVDCTDNFEIRYLINDVAILLHKPIVYGAIYKFEGQVSVFNYQDGPSYRCLFPNPPNIGSVANCSEIGVLGVLTGIIGAMQANEVIKIILGFNTVLSGKLYCYNSKTTEVTMLTIKPSILKNKYRTEVDTTSNLKCTNALKEVTFEAIQKDQNFKFIDIRSNDESPQIELPNLIKIPFDNLEEQCSNIEKDDTYVVICQSGIRSNLAVSILKQNNIQNCFSLKGGILDNLKYIQKIHYDR